MTTRPAAEVSEESVELLLEELLAEVVTGARPEPRAHQGHQGESITAALTGAAMASFSRAVSHASAVERALLVEALAPALAEALAPALAKALAPEIVTALSHLAGGAESGAESGAEPTEDEADESTQDESAYGSGQPEGAYDESDVADEDAEFDSGDSGGGSANKGKRSRE